MGGGGGGLLPPSPAPPHIIISILLYSNIIICLNIINLILKQIRKFLDNHCIYNNNIDISNNSDDVSKYFFSFPYFGQQSEKFKSEFNSIFRKYFPEIKVFINL